MSALDTSELHHSGRPDELLEAKTTRGVAITEQGELPRDNMEDPNTTRNAQGSLIIYVERYPSLKLLTRYGA